MKGNEREVLSAIYEIIDKGNSAEVKKEKEKIVIIEIKRKLKIKSEL